MRITVEPIVVRELEIRGKTKTIHTTASEIIHMTYLLRSTKIVKTDYNTQKSPGTARKLVVTQAPVIDHLLMLVWCLGILEVETINQAARKQKIRKEYFRRMRKLLETKLRTILKTNKEGTQIDQRTRKFRTIHKALHPRDGINRLYVSRKEGGRYLLKIVRKHLYEDSRTTLKRSKKDLLLLTVTTQTTYEQTEQQQ